MHRSVAAAVVAVTASIPATFAAVFLYLQPMRGDSSWNETLRAVLVFGVYPASRGVVVAAAIAVVLALVVNRVAGLAFALIASLAATFGGILVGYWSTIHTLHVSTPLAMAMCAITWLVTAVIVLAWSLTRKPRGGTP